ncbi:MAG: hypothetical protein NXI10_06280 [bacterium]|nr:hypothetical protein [bacterium]
MKTRALIWGEIVVLSFLMSTSFLGYSANYFVNDNSTTGDILTTTVGATINSGLTNSLPKASLSEIWNTYGPSGTNAITSGDTIFVDAGTYVALDANLNLNVSGITIIGAGSGMTIFDNDQSSSDANRWATITGNNITITGIYLTGYNYGVGDANVLQITGASNLTLNDVIVNENLPGGGSSAIVINGGSSVNFFGGGSSCNPGAASVAGGGVNIEGNGNTVQFHDYTFSANSKDYQGGSALRVTGDATTFVSIERSTFTDNENSSTEGGGAIFIANGATMTIEESCFNNNTANRSSSLNYGGAILVGRGSLLAVDNCTFDGNSATSSGNGGAIAINTNLGSSGGSATVTVDTCAFTNNAAIDGADILGRVSFSRPAIFTISQSTFTGSAEDVTNDNSASITIANSGSPSTAGTITFTNTDVASTTPSTSCPSIAQPCFSVLPVTFDDFWASCDGDENIQLNWSTLAEINNDYFILERATNDLNFEEIAKISGAGTNASKQDYFYIDRDAFATGYYRLSQVDYDGSRTFLKTIFSTSCNTRKAIYAHNFHQPTATLEIFFHVDQIEVAEISVISASGSIIASTFKSLSPDLQATKLQLNQNLDPGIYLISVRTQSESYQGRILVTQ